MRTASGYHLEKVGFVGTLFALACCLGIAPVLALMAAMGASFLVRDAILAPVVVGFLVVGGGGLLLSRRRHRRWGPVLLHLASGTGVFLFTFVRYDRRLIWLGVVGLVVAALWDYLARRSCRSISKHNYDYDIVTLGSGSAAFAAAIRASESGMRVAMLESREIGGTCVNRGCIPSKTLIRAAQIYHLAGHSPFTGATSHQQGVAFSALANQKDDLVTSLRQHKYIDVASSRERITILEGAAGFVDRHTVQLDSSRVTAMKFLIATGARAFVPDISGLDSVPFLTSELLSSDRQYELNDLPESLIILGGGFIGCELGQMFQRLGSRVTILQRKLRLLSEMDADISRELQAILMEEGVEIVCNAEVEMVQGDANEIKLTATVNGEPRQFIGQRLLIAAGVRANTDKLNLERVGVEVDARGFVRVGGSMRTAARNIWAAGDVSGPPLTTPVAAREGVVAAENMVDECSAMRMDYRMIPRAIFTDPEVASVGLTEEEARSQHPGTEAKTMKLDVVPKAACLRDTRGLVKMVVVGKNRRIVGVHLIGHNAADVIHEATVAIRAGWTVDDLITTIHVYPTMAEAIRMVAQTFETDVSKLSCCAE